MALVGIDKVLSKITATAAALSAGFIMLLMVIMIADIGSRTFTGASLPGAFEFNQTLVVFIVFFGIAYAERNGNNPRILLVLDRMPSRLADVARRIGLTVSAVVILAYLVSSFEAALYSYQIQEYQIGQINFPIWPAKMVITGGFFLLFLELTIALLRDVFNIDKVRDSTTATVSDREREETKQ